MRSPCKKVNIEEEDEENFKLEDKREQQRLYLYVKDYDRPVSSPNAAWAAGVKEIQARERNENRESLFP